LKAESIRSAVLLAGKIEHVFVATADDKGMPHIAVAGTITHMGGARVAISSWFCPTTLSNLQMNHHVSVVVWDRNNDAGYQLIGESEKIVDLAMMDGYTPSKEEKGIPQVEREIIVRVIRIIDFMQTLHSDMEG
jgi:uncharacterized protein